MIGLLKMLVRLKGNTKGISGNLVSPLQGNKTCTSATQVTCSSDITLSGGIVTWWLLSQAAIDTAGSPQSY